MSDLDALAVTALAAVADAATPAELDDVRVAFTGRKSELAAVQATMRDRTPDERKELGKALNAFKQAFEGAYAARHDELEQAALAVRLDAERVDVTLPARRMPMGRPHLLRQVEEAMLDHFVGLGYRIAEGPEAESVVYAFDALNIPADHPARQEMDTIYVADDDTDRYGLSRTVLRPHTSPVQARVMMTQDPPIAIVCPGWTYRQDVLDATHSPFFSQVEGLVVAEGITMADLRGTLLSFARAMFGEDREIRLRPSMFPFTEPSAEVDVSWGTTDSGDTKWMEVLGSGMVDPNVLSYCGIDPDRYAGFAFGIGIERVAMLRHGVADIREFFTGDERALVQF